jgi:thiamine biosynthesis protein ThiI
VLDHRFILRLSGDFYTKARETRLRFLRRLEINLRDALISHGFHFRLERTWSRFYLETADPGAAEVLARVFGLQSVSQAERHPWQTLDDVVSLGVEIFAPSLISDATPGRTFGVRATRRGKREEIPFNSNAVEIALGRALLDACPGSRVDLEEPEVRAYVELEPGAGHFFRDKQPGFGGLPIGVEGRAVSLVSGGFDSAVASWLMLKRGVQLDYVFCNLGGKAHRLGVLKVMQVVAEHWSYGYHPRLFEVDFRHVSEEIQAKTRQRNWQIHLKRAMLRAGEAVGIHGRRPGVITGDAMGQVSSQTLQNLAVISLAAPKLPILRPLIGYNKEEILSVARRMGIHDLAAAVREYCDLSPHKPATRAPFGEIQREDGLLDHRILEEALRSQRAFDLRRLKPEDLEPTGLETHHIEPGAVVLDLRPLSSYRTWHYPGALHLDFPRALEAFPSFLPDQDYVVYCEVGLKSAHLAERMSQAGLRVSCFAGGMRALMALAEQEQKLEAMLLAPAVRD